MLMNKKHSLTPVIHAYLCLFPFVVHSFQSKHRTECIKKTPQAGIEPATA